MVFQEEQQPVIQLQHILQCKQLLIKKKALIHTVSTTDMLKDFAESSEVVGLYLSASWCNSCRHFTTKLSACENSINNQNEKRFRIVFVSCDKTIDEVKAFFAVMPVSWVTIPFKENVCRRSIVEQFNITSIPALLLFEAKTGALLTKHGVYATSIDSNGVDFPWKHIEPPWYKSKYVIAILRQLPILLIILLYSCVKRNSVNISIPSQFSGKPNWWYNNNNNNKKQEL